MTHIRTHIFIFLVGVLAFNACQIDDPQPSLDVRLPSEPSVVQPNIVLIMADDLGYETIGTYGGESYSTPNIDQIAQEGIRFDNCYSQPLCTPSRVQLMTGLYNIRNYVRFGYLDEGQTTFAHLFKKAGYETCIAGKWQLGKDVDGPRKFGFERQCLWQVADGRTDDSGRDTRYSEPRLQVDGELVKYAKEQYGPQIVSDFSLDFITRSVEAGTPFLLYYPMILPHWPNCPTPHSKDWLLTNATEESKYGNVKYFSDMMNEMDYMVGRVNQHLIDLGIEDNTLLIFIGDNGTYPEITSKINSLDVKGGKWLSTDAGTRVPFVAKWPGIIRDGSVSEELIDFTDFLPTLVEASGLELQDNIGIDGKSFWPQMASSQGASRMWTYDWFSRSGEEAEAVVFARTKRYKLYKSGNFFDIESDVLEERPLELEGLDEQILQSHKMLQEVILAYKGRRLENVE